MRFLIHGVLAAVILVACVPVPVTVPPGLEPRYLGQEKSLLQYSCDQQKRSMLIESANGIFVRVGAHLQGSGLEANTTLHIHVTTHRMNQPFIPEQTIHMRAPASNTSAAIAIPETRLRRVTGDTAPIQIHDTTLFIPLPVAPASGFEIELPRLHVDTGQWQPAKVEFTLKPAGSRFLPFNC